MKNQYITVAQIITEECKQKAKTTHNDCKAQQLSKKNGSSSALSDPQMLKELAKIMANEVAIKTARKTARDAATVVAKADARKVAQEIAIRIAKEEVMKIAVEQT